MNLYKAFATVGGLTMISRLLGFLRDILIASALGSGAIADAFFVAFRFPNLFRRLFGEGAFNSAFVPLFAKRLEGEGEAAARTFAEEAMAGLLLVLVIVSAVAMLAMPWLMMLLAPGFAADPAKYDLAVDLTQIAFPYLTCMSLVALLSGVLNSMHRFWAAAAAPILLNVVLVAAITLAIALGYSRQPSAGYVLAIGVFVAGLAQLAMLWIAVRRAGMNIGFVRPRYTEGVRRLVALGIPGLVSGGITQINIVVGTIIASLQAGAVSYLYYADRLYQLPLGIVGVAIGVVLLPDISRRLRAGDQAAALDSQNRSLEFALMLTLPAAVALAVIAEPIIQVLFERGAFTAADTTKTAAALCAFAIGLPAFVLIKVFQPAFFAREDTKTPMYYAGINMAVNVAGSIGLFFVFQALGYMPHVGIALATTIAAWINAAMLWIKLARNGNFVADRRLVRNLPLIAVASLAMASVLWFSADAFRPWLETGGAGSRALIDVLSPALSGLGSIGAWLARFLAKLLPLLALTTLGMLVYALLIVVSGAMAPAQLKRFFRRKG